jgi:hypothetical protein
VGEQALSIPQYAVVQQGRRVVEDHHIDGVGAEGTHQGGGQLGLVTEEAGFSRPFIDKYGDVNITVSLPSTSSMGSKEVRLEDFPAGLQNLSDSCRQLTLRFHGCAS